MFFVYFVGSTLLAVFLTSRILFGGKKLMLPDWRVLGFLGLIFLSTIFSSHFYTSIWGYYSRFNGGLVSYLVFFGIYFVGINFLDQGKKKKVINAVCLSLFPISLYGIFQISEYDRIFSTLGQPNWLASYIVFVLPVVVGLAVREKEDLKRYFWMATAGFALVNLWFASSLSGVLGLVASFLYLAVVFRKKVFNKWTLVGLLVFLLFGAMNLSFFKDRMSDALVFSTDPESYKVSDPGLIRAGLWEGSLNMSVANPKNLLLGVGPETFPYEFPFFREGFLNYSSEWNFILNKPHNYYLEILVETGALALIFYFLIMFKTFKHKNKFMVAGLVGFYATNFFGWPTVYTSLLFWLWLSFMRINSTENTSP